jgi:thiol-disulfide isomerase/thioredoxin
MAAMTRRWVVLAGVTLAAGLTARKPHAQEHLRDLAAVLKPVNPPVPMPPITFYAADGSAHRLEEFHGHGMVINFWATWCAPCVAEMPSLAALSKALAPQDIAVLPLSSDRGGAKAVTAWFGAHGITGLPVLLDPKGEAAHTVGADGIPTSVVVDGQGRMRARLEGAANWSNPASVALVKKLTEG